MQSHLIHRLHSDFTSRPTHVLSLAHDPVQEHIFRLIVSSQSCLFWNIPLVFFLSQPGNFQEVPASQFVDCPSTCFFLIIFCQVTHLEQASCTSVRCLSLCCIRRTMTSPCPNVHMTPVHFVKVISARFLHFIVSLFAICNQSVSCGDQVSVFFFTIFSSTNFNIH